MSESSSQGALPAGDGPSGSWLAMLAARVRLEIQATGIRRDLRRQAEAASLGGPLLPGSAADALRSRLVALEAERDRLERHLPRLDRFEHLLLRLGPGADARRLLELVLAWEAIEDRGLALACLSLARQRSRAAHLTAEHLVTWLDRGETPSGRHGGLLHPTHPLWASGVLEQGRGGIRMPVGIRSWLLGCPCPGLRVVLPSGRGGAGQARGIASALREALGENAVHVPVVHVRGLTEARVTMLVRQALPGQALAIYRVTEATQQLVAGVAEVVREAWLHEAPLLVQLMVPPESSGERHVTQAVLRLQIEARRLGVPMVFATSAEGRPFLPLLPHAAVVAPPGRVERSRAGASWPEHRPVRPGPHPYRPREETGPGTVTRSPSRRRRPPEALPEGPPLEALVLPQDLRDRVEELCFAAQNGSDRLSAVRLGPAPWGKAIVALFAGPPGTGKTLLAAALAHHLGRPLISRTLGQLLDKYVGETEKQVEALFLEARERNAVLFLDEVDAMLAARGGHALQRHDDRLVNHLLVLIEAHEGLVLMATNRADILDEAVRRRVMFELVFRDPGPEEVEALWRLHLAHPDLPLARDLDLGALARRYPLRGGYILQACRKAALKAVMRGQTIDQPMLEQLAADEMRRVTGGAGRAIGFAR